MRCARVVFTIVSLLLPLMAQQKKDEGPTDEKAQKTLQKALELLHHGMVGAAFDECKDEHSGDAAIEGKPKKLIKRAQEKADSNPESPGRRFYGLSLTTSGGFTGTPSLGGR